MTIEKDNALARYPEVLAALLWFRQHPQLWVAIILFVVGWLAIDERAATLAGALFGAGATALGAWIAALNTEQAAEDAQRRKHFEARRFFAPELYRMMDRTLFIHGRASSNFVTASRAHFFPNETVIMPNDQKEDFLSNPAFDLVQRPLFRDLTGEEAIALNEYLNALQSLNEFVSDWWMREGQLPVNIFLMMLTKSREGLNVGLRCIDLFQFDRSEQPGSEKWIVLKSNINNSLKFDEGAMAAHSERGRQQNEKQGISKLR